MTAMTICPKTFRSLLLALFAFGITLSGLLAIPFPASSQSQQRSPLFDDFTQAAGWKQVIPFGVPDTGWGEVRNGVVRVVHHPRYKYHPVSMEKTYSYRLQPNDWVHFRFRMVEPLIGADMYTTIGLDWQEDKQQFKHAVYLIINGEQHWQQFAPAVPKAYDDEITFGASNIGGAGSKRSDIRVQFPVAHTRPRYSDWQLFSVKNEYGPAGARLRIFVNGREVIYRDIDAPYPQGGIDMRMPSPLRSSSTLTFGFSTLTDGDEYAATWDPNGVRYRWCYAQFSPARPTYMAQPTKRAKVQWMKELDAVRAIMNNGNLTPAQREFQIWQGIFGGVFSVDTAVLVGTILLPPPGHIQWTFLPPGSREWLEEALRAFERYYPPPMPMWKRFVWSQVFGSGNTALTVHHGYLTPQEVRSSIQWNYIPPEEKALIPEVAELCSSEMEWDYVIVSNAVNRHLLRGQVWGLIFSGRLGTTEAIFTELLPWQEAQFNCPYLSSEDIEEVRRHPLGSPNFCR